ncbi:MAG: hypothetical protein JWM34_3562 [Ilumatobacteraceae bacterium]|nr:hypothetical protein [Ilumatobacteraceae bacterium]
MRFRVCCCVLTVVGLAACNSDGRTLRPALPSQNQSVYTPTTTTVPATTSTVATAYVPVTDAPALAFVLHMPWADGGAIDATYTCNGADVSPAVSWLGAPDGTVEMALELVDTDANNFVHWIIAGLDPTNPSIPQGSAPVGAIEGLNGFSTATVPSVGYKGPCPPAGATHHYRATLYALSQQVELPTGSSASDLQSVIDSSAIGAAQVTGVYATP